MCRILHLSKDIHTYTSFPQYLFITPAIRHTHTLIACVLSPHISSCPQGPLSSGPLSSGAIAGVVLGGLVFLIVLAVIAVCVCVLVYGYRHPTSKIGLFMIEVCLYDVCVCTEQQLDLQTGNAHNFSTITSVAGQKVCFIFSTDKIPQQ